MRAMVGLLVALLVASNLAWWLTRSDGYEVEAAPVPPDPDANVELEELQRKLIEAQARIEQLETAQRREPLRAQGPDPAVQAARLAQAEEQRKRGEFQLRAFQLTKEWSEAALQTEDPFRRARAIEALQQALRSGDAAQILAALRTLPRIHAVEFDRTPFRSLVLACFASPEGEVRAAAIGALWSTHSLPEDHALLMELVADPSPEVRGRLAHQLATHHRRKIEGEAADAVLRLLDDADPRVRRATINGLSGIDPAPQVEQRLLELQEDPQWAQDVMYFALSTMTRKSPRVVAALAAALDDSNGEIARRALWGIGYSVPAESHAVAADALVRLLASRTDRSVRDECIRLLSMYGSARHVAGLEQFAWRQEPESAIRKQLEQLLEQLRKRN